MFAKRARWTAWTLILWFQTVLTSVCDMLMLTAAAYPGGKVLSVCLLSAFAE